MPSIGARVHELRITDETKIWRIVYYVAPDAIAIIEVFAKKSRKTPERVIAHSKKRLQQYWAASNEG
jgi:phage-related protein